MKPLSLERLHLIEDSFPPSRSIQAFFKERILLCIWREPAMLVEEAFTRHKRDAGMLPLVGTLHRAHHDPPTPFDDKHDPGLQPLEKVPHQSKKN